MAAVETPLPRRVKHGTVYNCSRCKDTKYEIFLKEVDGYDEPLEFARPCQACVVVAPWEGEQ